MGRRFRKSETMLSQHDLTTIPHNAIIVPAFFGSVSWGISR